MNVLIGLAAVVGVAIFLMIAVAFGEQINRPKSK